MARITQQSSIHTTGTTVENEPIIKSDGASSDVMQWLSNNEASNITISEDGSNNLDLVVSSGKVGVGASPEYLIESRANVAGTTPLIVARNQSASGDATIGFQTNVSPYTWCIGADASDGAKLKIAQGFDVSTNTALTISSAGLLTSTQAVADNLPASITIDQKRAVATGIEGSSILFKLRPGSAASTVDTARIVARMTNNSDADGQGVLALQTMGASNAAPTDRLTISSAGLTTVKNPGWPLKNELTNSGFDVWSNSTLEDATGTELVTNGNFSSGDTGWTKTTGFTIVDQGGGDYEGVATNAGEFYYLAQNTASLVIGKLYKVTITCTNFTDGSLAAWAVNNNASSCGNILTGTGTSTFVFEATATDSYYGVMAMTAGSDFRVDDITLKEVTPGCVAADALGPDTWWKDSTVDLWRQHNDGPTGTITINNGAGYAAGDYTSSGMVVDALSIALRAGQELYFSGSKLVISAAASASATTIYGTLTGATVVDDEVGYANNTKDGSFYSLKVLSSSSWEYLVMYGGTPTAAALPEHVQRFAGRTVTIGAWIKASDASFIRPIIQDGSDHVGSYHTGGGAWEWIEYTYTISASATSFRAGWEGRAAAKTAYISQPMLVFGSAIGAGNYSRPSGEIVYCEASISSNTFNGKSGFSNITTTTMNLEADSNGKIPKGAKAVAMKLSLSDSISSGNEVNFQTGGPSSLVGFVVDATNNPNNVRAMNAGWTPCDSNGDYNYYANASGSGTLSFANGYQYYGVQLR